MIQPLFMGALIRYFRYDAPLSLQDAYIAAAMIAFCAAFYPVTHHPYFFGLQKKGLHLKLGCGGMIMEKV
jgi:hypothetical protein